MERQKLIGQRIKAAREKLGMSQEELGRLYSCSDAHISRIENGLVKLGFADIERFASILRQPIDWFIKDEVSSPYQSPPQSALADLEVSINAYIPVYAEVSAGNGVTPIDYVACSRMRAASEDLRGYRVKGLCLEPEVADGDTVVVNTELTPQNNDLVVVVIDGQASIKRYHETDKGKWLENKSGKFQPEDVYLHGVVVESVRKWR